MDLGGPRGYADMTMFVGEKKEINCGGSKSGEERIQGATRLGRAELLNVIGACAIAHIAHPPEACSS